MDIPETEVPEQGSNFVSHPCYTDVVLSGTGKAGTWGAYGHERQK